MLWPSTCLAMHRRLNPAWHKGEATIMIKMSDEMRDLIDNALANGTPCILATATHKFSVHQNQHITECFFYE